MSVKQHLVEVAVGVRCSRYLSAAWQAFFRLLRRLAALSRLLASTDEGEAIDPSTGPSRRRHAARRISRTRLPVGYY
jgi:hypothetical protein